MTTKLSKDTDVHGQKKVEMERSNAESAVAADTKEKHRLQNRWVLYYDSPKTKMVKAAWGDQIKRICAFDTVEDFWCLFNNIVQPSKLDHGSNYWIFKDGIEPKWEDVNNAHGGSWTANISKDSDINVDSIWLLCILSLIGENVDDGTEVCGAVISVRNRGDRMAVWTRSAEVQDVQVSIGNKLKGCLEAPALKLEYNLHNEPTAAKSTAPKKAR